MRLSGCVVVVVLLASCSRWEAANPRDVMRSDELPQHSLVLTNDRAYELTDVSRADTTLRGTVVHCWSISTATLEQDSLDDLAPAQLARLLGWRPVSAPSEIELDSAAIRTMRVYEDRPYASAGFGVAGVLGTVVFAIFIIVASIPAAS